jgi:hypothetical protein
MWTSCKCTTLLGLSSLAIRQGHYRRHARGAAESHFHRRQRQAAEKVFVPKRPPDGARRAIGQGLVLLQHKGLHANSPISRLGYEKFGLSTSECSQVMNAARLYGGRPELVAELSRDALFRLSMPSLPATARLEIESRLAARERVTAGEIVRQTRANHGAASAARPGKKALE